ncbi:SUMF1/EgtB/PvdO family nonheme iron enzyme [Candidatus Cloacimonadota bacterium]
MKKSIIMKAIWFGILLTLVVMFGCVDKKSTEPDEILNYDEVDVTLIDNWDLWEYQGATSRSEELTKTKLDNSLFRDGYGYPALIEELYANIEQHVITIDGFVLDSATGDIESVHMMDCQIWTEDDAENPTYYYDFYFNEDSGALWLRSDTTPEMYMAVDPTLVDTVFVGPDSTAYPVDIDEYTLLFRHNAGPMLTLTQPENNSVIPDPEVNDLNDLTPKFKWNEFNDTTEEYTIQVRIDTMFSQETGFVYNELVTTEFFNTPADLDNFQLYYWRVKADNSDWSTIWNFATHEVVLLSNPTNNGYVGLKPTFSWDDLNGASSYIIQITQDVSFATGLIEETVTTASYVPAANLDPDVEYFWRVKGDNSGDNWSEIWSCTTDQRVSLNTPIDEKTEVELPVEFDWYDMDNTALYTIEVATDSLFANVVVNDTTTDSEYLEAGVLQNNVIYYWRVNSDVTLNWSDTLSFNTNNVVLLNSPEDTATEIGVITEFKWEKYNDTETVYVVQVADENTFAAPLVDSYIYYDGGEIACETASRIEEDDTEDLIKFIPAMIEDFDPSTMYYWRVQRDSLGWSNIWSFETLAFTGGTTLTEPLDAAGDVEPLPQFKWEAVAGIEFYRLQVSLDPNLADTLWTNKITTDRTYTLVNNETTNEMLLVGETYYWRARSDRTSWSDIWSFDVRTGIPYNVEALSMVETPNKVDISWECSNGEYTDFWIERSDDGGTTWTELGSVGEDARDFVDFDLAENTSYDYRVRSEYPLGYSDYSDIVTVVTETFSFVNNPLLTAITGGTYYMGSMSGDDDEAPVRSITLTHDYQIGAMEISNSEYCEVLNWALGKGKVDNAYSNDLTYIYAADAFLLGNIIDEDNCCISFSNTTKIFKVELGMEDHPVTDVKWFGAIAYTNWLSMIEGSTALYTGTSSVSCDVYGVEGYRLPTEAEWEFAAIGGTSSAGYTYSGSNTIDDVAWYIGNANDQLHPVGLKGANELGLKDMSGNAWEWCNDKYDPYDPASLIDPTGPTGNISNNTEVIVRGGCWEYDAYHLRNTNRSFSKANLAYKVNTSIGFRIVKINP